MVEQVIQDYLVRGTLQDVDPDVAALVNHETARQARTINMIPSESTVPEAVREAVGSAFHNIYAEGYPPTNMQHMPEDEILDYEQRLAEYRRYSDNRYYKGTEYANIIESLTRRRTAKAFATNGVSADELYVNVQPLSGAPANNAVYTALIEPGDTILSMDLIAGGHLSHGSPVNRSGKQYNIISYRVDPETETLNYDRMRELALEHQPKIIVGGYSSYPLAPDWEKYRAIADEVGAYLLADVAHFAGLVVAGAYPSPIGIADIITFTTHKTLNGARAAVIITHNKRLSSKIDRGVFPGEQGGPHMNAIAGLAVAFKLAQTDRFRTLQHQTVANARRLAEKLSERGLRIVYGGTDSHMLLVDLKPITGADGTALSGDMAVRILELAGIVCNRQTIPGDTSALRPSGFRLGTPWVTQRGAGTAEIDDLADIIADVILGCQPFSYTGRNSARAKIDFDLLQDAKNRVRDLTLHLGIDTDADAEGYPHFFYSDDDYSTGWQTFAVHGETAAAFLDVALTADVLSLDANNPQPMHILEADGALMASGYVEKINSETYHLHTPDQPGRVAAWLRSLSDGFVVCDPDDIYAKVPGPVVVRYIGETEKTFSKPDESAGVAQKVYFIGMNRMATKAEALPEFSYELPEQDGLRQSVLYDVHQARGARMGAFAGYDMPLWYDSVQSEHLAVRNGAGIFDVTHMGTLDVKGPGAEAFLDAVTTNDVKRLRTGNSHYTFLLDVNGVPFDDLLIYRLAEDHFFVVVNASNNEKNWAWLNAVKNGEVRIDNALPQRRVTTLPFELRDLRDESAGDDRRVDIALQGPDSRAMLLQLAASDADKATLKKLSWSEIAQVTLEGRDVLVSRTGYTGERVAYELFPHPDDAAMFFEKLTALGAVPCGLAARDSLRIEAGLPLYGHELGGPLNLNPADAGMGGYVKLYQPFFVGKQAFIQHEMTRDAAISRFRMTNKRARPAHQGDPVVDGRGRVVGVVTSCSIDSDGNQLGQVYLKAGYRSSGTELAVFAGSERLRERDVSQAGLGDRTNVPEPIVILRRFPKG